MTSKEEIIQNLVKAGMTQTDAEKALSEITPRQQTDADLVKELQMKKAELQVREDQLKQAIQIATKANDAERAREEADKQDLINRIIADSDSRFNADELKDKTKNELVLIKTTLSKSLDHTFASVAALQAEQDRRREPLLSAGWFDSKTQSWKGGL